jgi:Zn finger protein HypA/HybF involved in hydrogenase expression
MHELSLAGSILAIVEQAARTERFVRVRCASRCPRSRRARRSRRPKW